MKMKTTYFFTILTLLGVVCSSKAQSLNTFSGENAGANNTGNFNTGFGINSLKNNTSHSNNAFGFGTLIAASGGFNCAFGNEALSLTTTGNLNAAFGTRSLLNNTTGSKNIAIGHRTMEANSSGSNNTSVGYASLTTNNGNSNVAVGFTTPRNLISGDSNVFLGSETAINLFNGSYNVMLGNRITLNRAPSTPLLAGSDTNKSVIISDGAGVQRIFINKNGNTGIGLGNNVIPVNKLDIKGGVAIGKNFTPNGIAPIASAPINGLAVEGRLGIGTLAPNNKVEITQGTNGNSGLRFTNLTSSFVPTSVQSSNHFLSVNATGDVVLQKMSNVVQSNILSSAGNLMTSNVNGISSSTKIVNSIANSINESNQLITTVNGVSSAPVNLPVPNMEEIDGSVTNELQTISQSENTITLSNGGGSFILPTFTQVPQVISQSGNTISLSNGGGSFTFPTFTDTDAQSLALAGNTLSISNGNSVTLPTYVDVPQTISQSGNTISLSNGGGSFILPTFTQVPQVISQSGNTISLSNGGGSFTMPTTSVVAGTNVAVTGNGSAATPFLINATDKSIFADNGTIDQATTISGNRVVNMNNRNIWFNSASTDANGKIYIGSTATYPTTTGNYKLFVEGGILTEKVKVALRSTANWADYVFEKDYNLMPLNEVENYITANKHLPGIDSAAELATNGLDIAEMQAKHMAKIEELTLYIIEQNKAIERNTKAIEELQKQVQVLTANQD
ncbi:hypothetical protein [Flavobacterium sp.]|uniref:beta strand repeat-containing protein n=1 Tax=Flavobacterium sp. TaxID=239 RepID=UPI002487D146|nr:hypothetical protein [Flavobacterium sp.]MDI1316113.1 hypothetical protein [Flavobacterium sp.]